MSQKFDLHIRVTSSQKAATIVQLLDGEATLLKMEEVDDEPRRMRKTFRYANGHHIKAVAGDELVKRVLADGKTHDRLEIGKAFVANGFAMNSTWSTLSRLKAA